ncbi:DUF3040 domain-containing protein [Streptomyces sp. 142MFCol3.1]|uniref:DUF3040 domain-containing protein n=1 Tax=Streptomyces sp. 142MFCol3.1 TaxID=1172179 RepID=UPI00048A79E8|nr:DUF3040 domain-containing protein [Streptomyces sp. 142MFCol3.1]
MSQYDEEGLAGLEAQLGRDGPRSARVPVNGRTVRPGGGRRAGAWWMLAAAVVALPTGLVLPYGLLVAAGLVLLGIAASLFDPYRAPGGRGRSPGR